MDVRLRFWSWVAGIAYRRLARIALRGGHVYWWRDAESGRVSFDAAAKRAHVASMRRAGMLWR